MQRIEQLAAIRMVIGAPDQRLLPPPQRFYFARDGREAPRKGDGKKSQKKGDNKQRRQERLLKQAHRRKQLETNPAGSKKAEPERRADVLVEPIKRDPEQRGQD